MSSVVTAAPATNLRVILGCVIVGGGSSGGGVVDVGGGRRGGVVTVTLVLVLVLALPLGKPLFDIVVGIAVVFCKGACPASVAKEDSIIILFSFVFVV